MQNIANENITPLNEPPADFYNDVFERLVDDADEGDEQLVGLVAYGLYKIGKREWLVAFRQENGRGPTADECRLHARTQTETTLQGYKAHASKVVEAYASAVLDNATPSIVAEARIGSYWRSFWPSYTSSFAFSITLILLALILSYFGLPLPIIAKGDSG